MTGIQFLSEVHKVFSGDYHRLVKMATALRKLGLFPEGRKQDVTVEEAAHLIRAAAINVNPYNEEDFNKVIKYHEHLKNGGRDFIPSFAELLCDSSDHLYPVQISGGESQGLTECVHRVSFSLDRPFATIVRRRYLEGYNEDEGVYKSEAHHERETVYSALPVTLPFERFAIVKLKALRIFSNALNFIPEKFSPTPEDEKERQERLDYINLRSKVNSLK
jgi:hypothetical protein